MKSLVLYYSRTGNTRFVAEETARLLKADCEQIAENKHRAGALGYIAAAKDAFMRRNAEIRPLKSDIQAYELVVIGQPVWSFNMVPAVRSLLRKHRLCRKVALFCTMDGSGAERCFSETMKQLLAAKIVACKAFRKPRSDKKTESEIKAFVQSILDTLD